MPSPDMRSYVDLTLFDQDIQDLYANAIANLAISLPEWIPREGNVETVLLEGFALQVSEALFAINRLPNSLMQILLQMFGVYRDFGTPPIANLEFTVVDDVGYTIPAGTQAMLVIAEGITPVTFATDTDLTIPAGSTTGTVSATADQFTADANGVTNQTLSPVNSLLSVNTVTLVSITTPGRDQEDDNDWLNRGNQRLVQLSQALVLASQFQAAALEDVDVIRALAIDNYNPTINLLSAVDASFETGVGSWVAGTNWTISQDSTHAEDGTSSLKCVRNNATPGNGYAYTASYPVNDNELYSVMADVFPDVTAGATYSLAVHWLDASDVELLVQSVDVSVTAGQWNTLSILGMVPPTGAAKVEVMVTDDAQTAPASGQTIWVDKVGVLTENGSLWLPGGTGSVAGNNPGHITVAVYGDGVVLDRDAKAALQESLGARAVANLAVHVIDATIQTVDVTATVSSDLNYDDATVIANVTAAVESYLSYGNWDWSPNVRRNNLIKVIGSADGVSYVVSLTDPAADVAAAVPATLMVAGTVTITVSDA